MYKILIDEDRNKYIPQFNLSQTLDNMEFDLNKYDSFFIYIDNINLFRKYYKQYNKNKTTFIYDKNVVFNVDDINVKIIKYNKEVNEDFKKKSIKHAFIYDFLFKDKNI